MLGAGGIGGYFGARIHHAGGDVTSLVRPTRAHDLSAHGFYVISPLGDLHITPKVITSAQDNESKGFDAVILSCKAYDLKSAIDSVAPALAPEGIIVPLLNGVAHLARLDKEFGRERVLGGIAHIGVTLTPEGNIRHLNELHRLVIGGRTESTSPLIKDLTRMLGSSGFDFFLSPDIENEMWDKFVFLSVLAGATCTMRASIGDILETCSGEDFIIGLFDECCTVAVKHGHQPGQERLAQYRAHLTTRGSVSTASMLRDIERKGLTEAEHILGDMVRRAATHDIDTPLLKIAYSHLQAYEIRRTLEQT